MSTPLLPARRRIAWVRAIAALVWAGAFAAALGGDPDAGEAVPTAAAVLLAAYPLIDVIASIVEARASVQLRAVVNALISLAASVALAVAAGTSDAGTTLAVFGVWAIVSGAVQLGTAITRRELPMIASGAISTVAGVSFVAGSSQDVAHLTNVAGYAAFGAVLYLIWAARARR
ncbi:hypothetical protein [Solirubrobacter soli]|uniref:hypothetical protein n=1 Tax=Solirubrobacter soli TaxID=363832 RepID=UPI000488DF56|nr:hypothetical protein [Solirubrobacter soli]